MNAITAQEREEIKVQQDAVQSYQPEALRARTGLVSTR
jgi:hypothetical protein